MKNKKKVKFKTINLCTECGAILESSEAFETHKQGHLAKKSKIKRKDHNVICSHSDCMQKFKTKKMKLTHHNKLDSECRTDKQLIIRLIAEYKSAILGLVKSNSSQANFNMIKELESSYNEVKKDLSEYEYFNSTSGDNFYEIL